MRRPLSTVPPLVLRAADIFFSVRNKMMDIRATAWSVTINNPVDADEENINLARQRGWRVEGQKEVGENGTPHYQLSLKTPQVRFRAVKKAFPRAHIEVARNPAALDIYVKKEETRVGELAQSNELYPSLQKFWDLLYDYMVLSGWEQGVSGWIRTSTGQKEYLDADGALNWLDQFADRMICRGFIIETMVVNPQIRSIFKNFSSSILIRSSLRRQTDRQTDENLVSPEIQTDAECLDTSRHE